MKKRTILIGDVHGCLAELDELLEQVAYQKTKDRLIFVGDLVDRGPDSAGVVKRVQELGAECVLGNHEEKHLRWKRWEDKVKNGESPKNPMARFNEHKIAIQEGLSEGDFEWLINLPRTLRVGEHGGRNYVAVHGGLEPKYTFDKQGKQVIRIRFCDKDSGYFKGSKYIGHQPDNTQYWSELWTGPESVFYGHAVWDTPRLDDHGDHVCWGLDTGCCFGGTLTAALLEPGGESVGFASVTAHETYYEYREPRE
jgi:hypothetical protein